MSSVNKAILIGNIGADPESRTLQNGSMVVNLRVATTERWRQDGESKERTEWHSVVIWSEPLAKVASQYLRKGSKVYLEGQIQTRKWQDSSGADKYTTEIVLPKFGGTLVLLDSRGEEAKEEPQKGYAPRSQGARPRAADPDDDIPFAPETRV